MSTASHATSQKSRAERAHDALISPGGRLVRYALVVVIAGVATWLSLVGWFQICERVDSAKEGVTTTCSPPDLTSAGVLAAVILVLLLLWPDLSEFSAFGVTVKKLVQEVKEKVTENGRRIERIDITASDIDEQGRATLQRLDSLMLSVAGLAERTVDPDPPAAAAPPARWDMLDSDELARLSLLLVDQGELEARENDLRGMAESAGPMPQPISVERPWPHVFGMLIAWHRLLTQRGRGRFGEQALPDGRQRDVDDFLRLVDRYIAALLSGQPLDYGLTLTIVAVQWHLSDRHL